MTKSEARKFIKAKQAEIFKDSNYRIHESYKTCQKISVTEEFKRSSYIFAFIPLNDEVNIGGLIVEAFLQNKKVAVPKITGDGIMEFHWISVDSKLDSGAFGIYEPAAVSLSETRVNMETMHFVKTNSLLLVPGMAYSIAGKRLGRGKGFYDRFIKEYGKCFTKMGVCLPFQIAENQPELHDIPTDENDMSVDNIVF